MKDGGKGGRKGGKGEGGKGGEGGREGGREGRWEGGKGEGGKEGGREGGKAVHFSLEPKTGVLTLSWLPGQQYPWKHTLSPGPLRSSSQTPAQAAAVTHTER